MTINVENDTMLGRNNDSIYATKFYIMQKQIDELQQENKKQKEVINKAIEYIEGHKYTMKHYEPYGTPTGMPNYETCDIKGYYQLLNILKEVSE